MNSEDKQDYNNTNYNHNNVDRRIQRITFNDDMDAKYGFLRYKSTVEKIGWLINMQPVF